VAVALMILVVVYNTMFPSVSVLPDRGIVVFPALAYGWLKSSNALRWALVYYAVGLLLLFIELIYFTTATTRGYSANPPARWDVVVFGLGVTFIVAGVVQTIRVARRIVASRRAPPAQVAGGHASR
jgi:hypothetical protein